MQAGVESYNSKLISSATTTTIFTGSGTLGGVFCSSSSSGTVTVYDGTSASDTKIVDTFTAVAGTYHTLPFAFQKGLTIVTGGTISCAVAWAS